MNPRSQYYLYRITAVIALCAAVGFGIAAVLAAVQNRPAALQLHVGAAAVFGFLAWFAKKRSKALQAEQTQAIQKTAGEFFETFRQSPEAASGFSLQWNFRVYLFAAAVAAILCVITAVLVQKGETLVAVISALLAVAAARWLVSMLRQPERLHIGPEGLNDHGRFGVIPWTAIDNVSLIESVLKGDIKGMLHIKIDDIKPYLVRLAPIKRRLWEMDPAPDVIPFPLQGYEILPRDVFMIMRHFHERALPPGSISDEDNRYVVKR